MVCVDILCNGVPPLPLPSHVVGEIGVQAARPLAFRLSAVPGRIVPHAHLRDRPQVLQFSVGRKNTVQPWHQPIGAHLGRPRPDRREPEYIQRQRLLDLRPGNGAESAHGVCAVTAVVGGLVPGAVMPLPSNADHLLAWRAHVSWLAAQPLGFRPA